MGAGRVGSFDDLMREVESSNVVSVARNLREVILEGLPGAVEVVRLGEGAASYGVGPKKMSDCHVYVMPHAHYVNLGFYFGARLPDPYGMLEGSGKRLRHIKVRSVVVARSKPVKALIAAGLEERRLALGFTSPG
ncbi:hypothetical protein ASF87_10245 [Microbacterium sp. Leaf161]|uniref:DUF1801 domain-containing protein n=1 Tax=Microbacterium sp. Leaf161 TaxID=1736281 RepID=UPI0006F8DD57|nr:DUF1801 domain-containing protein [Microbacterium sp. Leaf161]KQR49164.1 hypothetical protein ASF87_10245 [Microbacterium sp. Leaf161]